MSQRVSALRTNAPVQVSTPGTAVRLADSPRTPSITPISVTVQALPTNTGNVTVGDSAVVAGPGTQPSPTARGITLRPYDAISIDVADISDIWVDAVTANDGVTWVVGVG